MLQSLKIENLSKKFGNNNIFKNISFEVNDSKTIVFLGQNGTGKSTLIKILCGYLYFDSGKILWNENQTETPEFAITAPYIDLFEQLTLEEHLTFHFNLKKRLNNISNNQILELSLLNQHKNKLVKQLSSGLKQRFKNVLALFSETPLMFLDEPCSNLDEQNILLYQKLLKQFSENKFLIIASNNKHEYDFLNPLLFKIENCKIEIIKEN